MAHQPVPQQGIHCHEEFRNRYLRFIDVEIEQVYPIGPQSAQGRLHRGPNGRGGQTVMAGPDTDFRCQDDVVATAPGGQPSADDRLRFAPDIARQRCGEQIGGVEVAPARRAKGIQDGERLAGVRSRTEGHPAEDQGKRPEFIENGHLGPVVGRDGSLLASIGDGVRKVSSTPR